MMNDVVVMVENLKKDDGRTSDNVDTSIDLIDAGEARTRISILGMRRF